jgi:nucleoside-diphosphate-sugar epimerase
MKVLITGGTGYLGGALLGALLAAGHRCVVFARTASANAPRHELVEPVDGDVRDRDAVQRAAAGVDAICHAAALVSIWRARAADFDEVNVGGLQNVIDACRAHGIARIVYTSSFLALPPAGRSTPITANDYQRTKVAGLALARGAVAAGTPIITLAPGVIYGPGRQSEGNLVGRLVHDHLARRLPGIVGGDRVWSFTHVDDVVRAHVAALTTAQVGAEIIVGGENAPQVRLFEYLRELRGTPLPRRIPFRAAWVLASIEEARTRINGRPPLLTRAAIEIFRHDWPLDPGAAGTGVSQRPIELREGLRRLLESEK